MSVYTENIELLKAKNSQLAEKIENLKIDKLFNVFPSKAGLPTIEITKENRAVLLHSSYNPQKEASSTIEEYNLDNALLIVVYGFGLGYYIREIINKVESKVYIWIFEADLQLLKIALQNINLSEILKRERLYIIDAREVYEKKETFLLEIRNLFFPSFPKSHNVIFVPHPVLHAYHHEVYNYITERIKDAVTAIATSISTEVIVGPQWILNTLLSIKHILKAINMKLLENKWSGKPAICVGAGPSLDKNIEFLKELKNKALIIAVGPTLKPLLKYNILPDFICMVDAKPTILKQLEGLPPVSIPLVTDPMVYYKVFEHFTDRKILSGFMHGWDLNPALTIIEKYIGDFARPGGAFSVSAIAFSFAKILGANPIILVGQDLAFSKEGKTHATFSPREDWRIDTSSDKYIKVKGNVEEYVLTNNTFFAMKSWFITQALQNPHLTIINATEGGAYIEGTKVMTLKEAKEKYCNKEYNISSIFENIPKERKVSDKTIKKIKMEFENLQKQIEILNKLSSHGLKLLNDLITSSPTKTKDEKKEILKKVKNILSNMSKYNLASKILYPFLKGALMFVNREKMYEILPCTEEEIEEKALNIEQEKAEVLLEEINAATKILLPYFENIKKI